MTEHKSRQPRAFPWSYEKTREYTRENCRIIKVKGRYLTRAGIWLLTKSVRALSYKGAWNAGKFFGWLMAKLDVRKDVAMTNLDIVYGDSKTKKEKESIYRGCLVNVARQAVNYLRTPVYSDDFWENNITFNNLEPLEKAYNKGKGVIIISMHYGGWEIAGGKIGMSGFPISNIIKIIKNPAVEMTLINARLAMNLGTIPHKGSIERIKKGLARGEGIIMAIDQNMKRSQGAFVKWFGKTASTIKSTAYIARETGAAVVAGYSKQVTPDKFEVMVIGEIPWESREGDPEKELLINTENYIKVFEKPIYDEPEGWLWLHRRWKVQPDEKDNPYLKIGPKH